MRLEALQHGGVDTDGARRQRGGTRYSANASTTTSSESANQEADTTSNPDTPGPSVPLARTSKAPLPTDAGASTVDLNSASEQELAAVPGLGTTMAKRAVGLRESQGGYRSVEDFGRALNLEPHAIDKIRALVSVSPSQRLQRPPVSSEQPVTTHDVSEISVLRKRLGHAAFSMKVIGLLSAYYGLVYFPFVYFLGGVESTFPLLLAFSILVLFCAVRLSKRLRARDMSAAKITAVWWVLFVAVNVFDALPTALTNENFDLYSVINLAISTLPIYFVARGLLALRAYESRSEGRSREAEPLTSNPWGSGEKMEKHPAFINKWSLHVYLLLMVLPAIWVLVLLYFVDILSTYNVSLASVLSLPSDKLAELIGVFTSLLVPWYLVTVSLYRRARRRALLPATELTKRNPRPIILYLRSFLDDKIKMRARAVNGRSFLETVVKIPFEEVITDHLWRYGPVVAIGKPGDTLPPLGAARDYVSDGSWHQKVEQLMAQASIIVVVVGRTEGLAWELTKIIELGLTRKLVLLLPPVQVDDLLNDLPARWDSLCEHASKVGLRVPRNIDLRRTRAVVFLPGQGAHAIAAEEQNDRAYETVLDAAAELIRSPGHRSESAAATGSEQQDIGAERDSTQPLTPREREASRNVFIGAVLLVWSLVVLPQVMTTGKDSKSDASGVVFEDNFTTPSLFSRWPRLDDKEGVMRVTNSAYHMNTRRSLSVLAPQPDTIRDASVEVNATKIGDDAGKRANWGVTCRVALFEEDQYFLGIFSDGSPFIGKLDNGEASILAVDTPADAVNKDMSTNHIRGDCVGSRLTLYVNDRKLLETEDAEFTSGGVGLAVERADISFDNFLVSKP
jgi:DNA uptake protein ComE-like DNA-binding protein